MKRLVAWPDHHLTMGLAACVALLAAMDVAAGDFGWRFWAWLVLLVYLVGLARHEKRRGDRRRFGSA